MSQKEVKRAQVLDRLKENKIDRQEASRRLCITTRQVRRLRRRYQLDGSPHDWFEGRGEYCTLLVFIDDATALYTDRDHTGLQAMYCTITSWRMAFQWRFTATNTASSTSMPRTLTRKAETQFSRAAREREIECIHAHSPQAKGRVARVNKTLQDRLVKDNETGWHQQNENRKSGHCYFAQNRTFLFSVDTTNTKYFSAQDEFMSSPDGWISKKK